MRSLWLPGNDSSGRLAVQGKWHLVPGACTEFLVTKDAVPYPLCEDACRDADPNATLTHFRYHRLDWDIYATALITLNDPWTGKVSLEIDTLNHAQPEIDTSSPRALHPPDVTSVHVSDTCWYVKWPDITAETQCQQRRPCLCQRLPHSDIGDNIVLYQIFLIKNI